MRGLFQYLRHAVGVAEIDLEHHVRPDLRMNQRRMGFDRGGRVRDGG